MGALFQIVAYSIGNLFLGILLTVVGVILLFVLIQSWYRNSTFTPVSYIVGGILFLFLSFQSILLCGAVTIKSYSEDVEGAINSWVAEVPSDIPFNQECKKRSRLLQQKRRCCYSSDVAKLMFSS